MKNYFKVLLNAIAAFSAGFCSLLKMNMKQWPCTKRISYLFSAVACKRMHSYRLMLIFCLLLAEPIALLGQENTGFRILNQRKEAEIPFQAINNLIVVSVLLDNLIPLNFLVDTGVRTAILTDRFYSDLLSINYDRKLSIRGAGNRLFVEAYIARDVAFKISDVQAEGQSMLVLQDDYLQLSAQLGTPVHGIIGYDFFQHFVVKIDYAAQLMTLYEPAHFKHPRSYDYYPLTIEDTKPYISCELVDVEGKETMPVKLMLDTGASHALLLHQEDSCSGITLPDKTIYGTLGRGLVGDVVGHIGRIPRLELSKKYAFEDVLTSFPEENTYKFASDQGNRDGTIGGELLHRFTAIFDYSRQAFYLSRNKHYRQPFILSKTGFTLTAEGEGLTTFRVIQVRENTPAEEAGIKVGDVLMKLNGTRAKNLTLMTITEKLRKRDGKKIRLHMKRGEEEYKTTFRLRNII